MSSAGGREELHVNNIILKANCKRTIIAALCFADEGIVFLFLSNSVMFF